MSEKIKIHIGSADEMGQRFIEAWKRSERGEEVTKRTSPFATLKRC